MDPGIIAGTLFTVTTIIQLFSIYKMRRKLLNLKERVDTIEQLYWLHINGHNPIHVMVRETSEDPETCRS
jgi:hypothetical protein